ncbi:MAG: hypothetical protein ACSLE6_00085 [Mycobacterium sp.]
MTSTDSGDKAPDERESRPIFEIPQHDSTIVVLDFTTPGPFGDFAFTARVPRPDGTVRRRTYGAYHTDEAPIFIEILQHWARVAHPDDVLAGLDRAEAVLRFLTDGLEPTTRSQNDFDDLLHRGIEVLATMDFAPANHEHSDERGDVIVLAARGTELDWISRRDPSTTFAVPPTHLWVFVTGMLWRTYDHDSIPLSRLNTAAYETAVAAFRSAISDRSQSPSRPEPAWPACGEDLDESRLSTAELVQRLCEMLGAKLIAYLGTVDDTRTVRAWADFADDSAPPDEVIERLRIAYQAATLLSEKDTASVIQAWFQGRNPLLDDMAPARVLRDGEVNVVGANVMAAARALACRSSEM